MHKLSYLVEGKWTEHSFPPLYELEMAGEQQRLVAGIPRGQVEPFERLACCLAPPYFLLYVLHTPRGEGEPGRYQSAETTAEEFRAFMNRFGSYLSSDARFDLWLHSQSDNSTLVWDRRSQLFAYGQLNRLESELRALGFTEGRSPLPTPHQHHYRVEFDSDAAELLSWNAWRHSPLRPEDEQ